MHRFALPLLTGLGLTVALVACGDDKSTSNCDPGTVLQNGVCVADNTADTLTGLDTAPGTDTNTNTSTTPPPDTFTGNDTTTTPPEDTAQETDIGPNPNECTPEEASMRDVGEPCTKDCQCDQSWSLFCYDGAYMSGFRFCTREGLGAGLGKPAHWEFTSTNSACPDWGNTNTRIYVRGCSNVSDCKAIASAYTHCGTTGLLGAEASSDTRCCDGSSSGSTVSSRRTCLINTLPPFQCTAQ